LVTVRPSRLNLLQHYLFQFHSRKARQNKRRGSYPIDAPQGNATEPSGATLAALFLRFGQDNFEGPQVPAGHQTGAADIPPNVEK
jgi:hypothetical protein